MTRWSLLLAAGAFLASSCPLSFSAADDARTVGRVRVTTVREDASSSAALVAGSLAARFAPASEKRFADVRVLSVRPRLVEPGRFDVTIYDYTVERAYDLVLDAAGNELSRRPLPDQPARSLEELADAETIVGESPAFAPALAAGSTVLYEPMPALTVDADGRRLVNVGVRSPVSAGQPMSSHEIVSVHIPTESIVRYPSGAPETSRASLLACGPPNANCGAAVGSCSFYQVLWPSVNPVWKLNIRHPSCTQSVQPDGTGLELTDVYYKGRLILKRAELPVVNVKYDQNTCGPFRDQLYTEDCFQVTGTDVPSSGSGIRVASAAPTTLCETGSDAGNFRGVAIYDQGENLLLMTETTAGWYHYAIEWRLHLDGTIEPVFGFGATTNSCTCNLHFHHAYWRFEWAIDAVISGGTDDPATGIDTLERRRSGTLDTYDPIATEGMFTRPMTGGDQDFWRVKNPSTGNGYVVEPGLLDGTAVGDSYGKWDLGALALNPNQIDDPNGSSGSVTIDPWVNGEALGATKRLVTWYHATYTHNDPNGTGEVCELVGPKLVPLVSCAGSVSLDRLAYTCNAPVTITLSDADLAGTGSAIVTVASATETTPESVTLTETPAASGRFQGVIQTSPGPPVAGDGQISVVDGDTLHVHYVDASSCGTPNVPVDKTVPIDCIPPAPSSVQAAPSDNFATITWTTNEPSTSVVHYGTSLPTTSSASVPGLASTHAVSLTGLAACTTYYYWVASTDAAGNVASSNAGGGTFAFTTGQNNHVSFTSTDTPKSIPDNNATGATSTIAVGTTSTVLDANVQVNVTHTSDIDLSLYLITPAGTSIPLALTRGGNGDNYRNTVFDDQAATPISSGAPPFTGSFQPESPLSVANGISAAGSWKFKVVDLGPGDVGTIDNWTLTLSYPATACLPLVPPHPVPDGTFGTPMAASRTAADGSALHLGWDAATCPAKSNHLIYGTLQNVASYQVNGGVCGLGPAGSYDWTAVPSGDLWFLVVSDDAASTEGSWGTDGAGAQRNGSISSGVCGFTARSNSATCP